MEIYAEYTEKEIAIFVGLMDLIKGGANPYTIKVSDIAKAANIGKGTIYDYFSTKEEVISKAILYFINNEIEAAFLRIKSISNFKEKFYEILFIMVNSLENNLSPLNILISAGGIKEFYEHITDEKHDMRKCLEIINEIIKDLIETGHKEGKITTKESMFYQTMAVRGVIAGFSHYLNRKKYYNDISLEEAMGTAYKLLIKSLD